ncbi:probable cytochrome P450 12a5, mitochondrial [Bactrocera tryoni]|uniref:probable cytochrome P450 12a5, mitochondrial n=1 Tax=Bactrocera tryoni TaxID=59916 RepID=UPI001A966F26|nr:probable cytochrome P450 12a5, mitochondrial [Bactrocera tryoni]
MRKTSLAAAALVLSSKSSNSIMFYAKINCVALSECAGLTKSFTAISKRLLATKQLEDPVCPAQSTISLEQPTDASLEWQRARPYSELPQDSVFRLLTKFLPGGRYKNLDSNALEMAMKEDHGDIFVVPAFMGRPSTVVIHNPEDFARVFRNEGVSPIRPFATLRYYRSKLQADFFKQVEGVLTTQGERWSTFRSAVNPLLMQPKNVQMYLGKMAQVNQEFVERIRAIRDRDTQEMPNNFEDYLQCWLLESLSIVTLGKQLGLLRDHSENYEDALKLLAALNTIFTVGFDLEWKPSLWRRVRTPKFRRFLQALDDMQTVTLKYVDEAIANLEAEKKLGIVRPENEMSAFERLLKIDKKIATVMCLDLFLAGINTTTSFATAILLCLAKNPEKQQILRKELMRVLPQKDGDFTADALNNISYLRACIKEAIRIYPLTVSIVRVTQSDLVLSGYRVPKGSVVNMVFTSLFTNENYFARPKEYLPERWLRSGAIEEGGEQKSAVASTQGLRPSNPFVYLPFGFGPRVCLGRRVSELEIELGIARLVRNFQIEFNHPIDKPFKSMFVNMPNIPLKFKFSDIE